MAKSNDFALALNSSAVNEDRGAVTPQSYFTIFPGFPVCVFKCFTIFPRFPDFPVCPAQACPA